MVEAGGDSFRKLSRRWYLGCCLLDAMRYGKLQDILTITKTADVDPNIMVPEYGIAPMHCAAGIEPEEFGVRCVQELLRVGGDANVRCSEGVTPVHVASCWGRLKVLSILLRGGGDPYLLDDEGNDAFYYAQGNDNVFHLLKNYQNDKHTCNEEINSPKQSNKEGGKENIEMKAKSDDVDMNPSAFTLIMKHRQGILLFESLPEEDSSSSTTLNTELNEDFSFEPKGAFNVPSQGDIVEEKDSRAHSDSEIYAEDILSSDKTNVIKVINDNVNRSKSHISFDEKSSEDLDVPMQEDNRLDSTWADAISNHMDSSNVSLVDCKQHEEDIKNENVSETSMKVTSSINIVETGIDNNEVGVLQENSKIMRSRSDCSSASRSTVRSRVERSTKSELESNNTTSYEPKDTKNLENKSSQESDIQSENSIQLPKKVREKLLCFKVNTHYRTRIYKLVSRSCDGLTSKKSLYTSGYEFWSTRVKSKSYPCYIAPIKQRE